MSEQVWYYSQHGERKGPVTLEVIQGAIAHGKIDLASDLVWGPGLSDWVKVDQVPELQSPLTGGANSVPPPPPSGAAAADSSMSNIVPPSAVAKARATGNPYASPESENALQDAMNARNGGSYPGMGRVAFILWNILLGIGTTGALLFLIFGLASFSPENGMEGLGEALVGGIMIGLILIYLGGILVSILIACSRLKNLSMSRWNYLWSFIPFANIWLSYRLVACPAGYQQHKQLDTPGKVIKILFILLIVLYMIMLIFSAASAYKKAADEAASQVELEQSQ
ncbi:DUF4339 domain-containing protein [Rubritalea sp.]|uniref:DUF4339 domain-containing protein n=1 Tax=Rubritalea sp. TaxID=2109375 RepID=UPI003EF582EB